MYELCLLSLRRIKCRYLVLLFFCIVAPENASLSSNLSTVPVVCVGMVVRFTCTVAACNPAVDTFTLYENGVVISDKTGSGVWIKTLDAGGKVTYKCQAKNSEGTSSSSKTLFSVEGEATKFLFFFFFKKLSTTIMRLRTQNNYKSKRNLAEC